MHKPGLPCLTIFSVSMPHYCSSSSETVCLKVASHALQAFNVRARRKPSHAKSDLMLNLTRRRLFVRAVPTDTNPAHLADTWKFRAWCSSASLAGLQANREPSSYTRELFASGHVIKRLRYAFPIYAVYAPRVHVNLLIPSLIYTLL